jgi:DNA topoisomerase III
MATLIIAEKTSQAKDLAAALGSRYGKILPAEGHLLRLAEPDEIDPAWKRWSCTLLKPDGLYPTGPPAAAISPRSLRPSPRRSNPARR